MSPTPSMYEKAAARCAELEAENATLRRRVEELERELSDWQHNPPPNEQDKRDLALRAAQGIADAYELESDSEGLAFLMAPIAAALDQHDVNTQRALRTAVEALQDLNDAGLLWCVLCPDVCGNCIRCRARTALATIAAAAGGQEDGCGG